MNAPDIPNGRRLPIHLPLIVLVASAQLLGVWTVHAAWPAPEQNWPQWRGPLGTAVAPTADPPVVWSETNKLFLRGHEYVYCIAEQ